MKRFTILIPLMTICCLMVGCSTSEIAEPITQTSMATYANVAPQFSNAMLSFEKEAAMKEAVNELLDMTESERNVWYIGQNADFISQEDAMWAVVAELNTKKSMEEIRSCQDKYSDLFLFNKNEADECVAPYIPNNGIGLSLISNPYGNVIIAGDVVNFNDLKSYEETDYAIGIKKIKTRSAIENHNYLKIETPDRKMWAEAKWNGPGNDVFIKYVAQEKLMWPIGWNNYKTQYHVTYDYIVGYNGVNNLIGFYVDVYNNQGGLWTGELKSEYLSRCLTPKSGQTISIGFRIYSRGTGAGNDGLLKIKFEQ